jgi:hypothetical protein
MTPVMSIFPNSHVFLIFQNKSLLLAFVHTDGSFGNKKLQRTRENQSQQKVKSML